MTRPRHAIAAFTAAILCTLAALGPVRAQKPQPAGARATSQPAQPAPALPQLHEVRSLPHGQHAYSFVYTAGRRAQRLNYLLYIPESYGKDPYAAYPLIVFLHGSRELGGNIALLHNAILPARLDHDADFPAIVVSPQSPVFAWDSSVPAVTALLDELQASLSIDPNRIYLTGLSMGAYGVWALAMAPQNQQRFAALVSVVGGYYYDAKRLCALKDVPVWVFAGAKDRNVNPKESVAIVQALRGCGADPKFTMYDDANHDQSWTRAFEDPHLFEWLLEQRTGGAEGRSRRES